MGFVPRPCTTTDHEVFLCRGCFELLSFCAPRTNAVAAQKARCSHALVRRPGVADFASACFTPGGRYGKRIWKLTAFGRGVLLPSRVRAVNEAMDLKHKPTRPPAPALRAHFPPALRALPAAALQRMAAGGRLIQLSQDKSSCLVEQARRRLVVGRERPATTCAAPGPELLVVRQIEVGAPPPPATGAPAPPPPPPPPPRVM